MERSRTKTRTKSAAACQFCRTRKLKCDNNEPPCSECRTRGLECTYVRRPKNPRPSNRTIHALEAENKRLRELANINTWGAGVKSVTPPSLQQGQGPAPEHYVPGAHQPLGQPSIAGLPQQSTDSNDATARSSPFLYGNNSTTSASALPAQPNEAEKQSSETRLQISSTGRSSYHGPTSTLFDTDSRAKSISNYSSSISTEWLRNSLVAATLRQRQKESISTDMDTSYLDGWDADLVLHLLNIHWNRQHHNLLLVYRPAFMRDMVCGGPYYSKLLLNSLLFAAAKFSPRLDIRKEPDKPSTAGWQFLARVKQLLGEAMDNSTIPTIQALITVASSLFAIGDERSTSWLYSGTAFRMIVDLGLHIDGADLVKQQRLSIEDLEIRRRVFWGAFVFDKIHSMYQGRPVTLQERDMQVPPEFLDDFEELELWVPLENLNYTSFQYPLPKHPGAPTHSVSTFTAFCRLSIIMNRTINVVYAEKAFQQDEQTSASGDSRMLDTLHSLGDDLSNWWDELQPWLKYEPWATATPISLKDTPCPTILSLQCMYHIFVILLHRPYLSRGHLYSPEVASHCLFSCAKAAMRIAYIVQSYSAAFTVRRAPYFVAYSAYVASTILIFVAARQEASCNTHKCLSICFKMLEENEKINTGVKRANYVVGKLLKETGLGTCPWTSESEGHGNIFGETVSDEIEVSPTEVCSIIDSFSMVDRDSAAGRRPPNGNMQQSHLTTTSHRATPPDKDFLSAPSTSISLGGSMTSYPLAALPRDMDPNTTGVYEYQDPDAFDRIIFGLHGAEFLDSWPDFFGADFESFAYT